MKYMINTTLYELLGSANAGLLLAFVKTNLEFKRLTKFKYSIAMKDGVNPPDVKFKGDKLLIKNTPDFDGTPLGVVVLLYGSNDVVHIEPLFYDSYEKCAKYIDA